MPPSSSRYLTQRERWLLKRRRMAEEALRQQQELLEREQRLEREEEEVGRLVDRALQHYQSRHTHQRERKPVGETPQSPRTLATERILRETSRSYPEEESGSRPKEVSDSHPSLVARPHTSPGRQPATSTTSASIAEDLSEETVPGSGRAGTPGEEYSTDTFESLEGTPTLPPSTSTPAQPKPHAAVELSVTGSLKTSEHSISGSDDSNTLIMHAVLQTHKQPGIYSASVCTQYQ